MKKIFLISILGLIITTSPAYAAIANPLQARENHIASRTAATTQFQANQTQDLKQRAQTEITRRLNFLTEDITRINNLKKLSATDKAGLQTEIQTQIDGLKALQTKINADTDLTTLRTDVKSIIGNYYIFAFFRVKIELLVATDRMFTATDNLNAISTKLQTRINQAQAAGNDVTSLNILLSDMNAKIADAKTQYTAAETELASLTAAGYPGNKTSLQDARAKIKAGAQDLKAAYQDAISIRKDLESLKISIPGATSSAH